jgi:predicted metal-binding membrane protein
MFAPARGDRAAGHGVDRPDRRDRRRARLSYSHPLWWAVGGTALAWLGLAWSSLATPHHHSMSFAAWALMSVATTTPLTLPAVRHVYGNSIRVRRQWASLLYLVAYTVIWLVFGAVALLLPLHTVAPQWIAVALLVVAGLWQLTRTKSRALRACRRTIPLPPQGRRADLACVRFGFQQGWRCLVSCWPLMLLMALVPLHLAVMGVVAAFMYAEERTKLGREMVRQAAALLAVAAIGVAAFG